MLGSPTAVTTARTGVPSRMETLSNAPLDKRLWYPSADDPSEACHAPTAAVGQAHAIQRRIDKFQKQFPRPARAPRKVVYSYSDAYMFSRIVMSDDLVFDSHFESGNLQQASRIKTLSGNMEYELVLSPDPSKKAHVQWFFFSVKNMRARVPYTFHLVNFLKPDAMYNYGQKPLAYSVRAAEETGMGWHRVDCQCGDGGPEASSICYYKAPRDCADGVCNYILTFTHVFLHDRDTVYFASCFPYTYTDLQQGLGKLCRSVPSFIHVDRAPLCRTEAGNVCELITLHAAGKRPGTAPLRKWIVISGRVHPGESNASWIVHGILQMLLSDCPESRWLLSRYVIKVVPMLNPDGVINGYYRTCLSGHDMNRCWADPDSIQHAPIAKLKELLAQGQAGQGVELFCDVHGHSRKEGVFMYGCVPPATESETPKSFTRNLPRVLPMIMSKTFPAFSYPSCDFKILPSKATTARVVGFNELNIMYSFTLEASLCGYKDKHFRTIDLMEAGACFCKSLVQFFEIKRKARQAVLLHLRDDAATLSLTKGSNTPPVAPPLARVDAPDFAVSQSREYFQSFSVLMAKTMDAGLDDRGVFVAESKLRVSKELHLAVEKASSMADVLRSPTSGEGPNGWSFLSVMPQRDLWFLPGQHVASFPHPPAVPSPLADLTPTNSIAASPSPPSHRSARLSARATSTLAPISRAVSPITSPRKALGLTDEGSPDVVAVQAEAVPVAATTSSPSGIDAVGLTIDTSKHPHPPRPLKTTSCAITHLSKQALPSPKYTALAAVLIDLSVKPGKNGAAVPVVNSMAPAMPERKTRRSVPPRPRATSAANKYQLPPSNSSESPEVSPAASPLITPQLSGAPLISPAWIRKSTSAGPRKPDDSPGGASVGSTASIGAARGISSATSRGDKQRGDAGTRSRSSTPKPNDLPKISAVHGVRPPSALKSRRF